jgi:mannosyltransferase
VPEVEVSAPATASALLTGRPLTPAWSVTAATLLAAVACLVGLGRQPFSWDEAVSLNAARRGPGHLWTLLRHTDAPLGAYYYGLHLWLRLGAVLGISANATWVRLPSALAVIAAVGLTTALACRLLGPVAGLVSGVVLALHPLVEFYAQDARPYAIAMLLAVATTRVLLADLRMPRMLILAGYTLLAIAALYDQFWSVFVIVAHGILVLMRGRRRWRYAIAAAVIAVAVIPLVVFSQRESGEIWWIPAPSPSTILGFVTRICGGIGGIAMMAVLAVALVAQRRHLTSRWHDRDGALAVTLWVLVPPLGLILFSFWQPMMVPRYALVFVPAWAIVMVGLCWRLPRRIALVIGALLVAVSLVGTVLQSVRPYKYEDFRAIAAEIRGSERPGDGIVYVPTSYRVGMEPYLSGGPADILLADPASVHNGPSIGGTEVGIGQVAVRIDGCGRIYLIGPILDARQPGIPRLDTVKERTLRTGFRLMWRRTYGAVSVTLLTRTQPVD